MELHLAWALAALHYEALFILTTIPWGNDSGFTSQLGKPGLRANAITGWDHTDLNGAELQVSTVWPQVWEFLLCLVWLAPSFWEWEAKIQNSVPSICWESLRCIQREAVSFVFLKCPPLNVCVCVYVCVLLSPSLTWDHIFPGSVVEPDPWWRSQAWQPSFISLPLGWRIYLWCQAWARFRIIQGFKSWGYEK